MVIDEEEEAGKEEKEKEPVTQQKPSHYELQQQGELVESPLIGKEAGFGVKGKVEEVREVGGGIQRLYFPDQIVVVRNGEMVAVEPRYRLLKERKRAYSKPTSGGMGNSSDWERWEKEAEEKQKGKGKKVEIIDVNEDQHLDIYDDVAESNMCGEPVGNL